MHNAFLIGPTLYLRPLEKEDARLVTPWFNNATMAATPCLQSTLIGHVQSVNHEPSSHCNSTVYRAEPCTVAR